MCVCRIERRAHGHTEYEAKMQNFVTFIFKGAPNWILDLTEHKSIEHRVTLAFLQLATESSRKYGKNVDNVNKKKKNNNIKYICVWRLKLIRTIFHGVGINDIKWYPNNRSKRKRDSEWKQRSQSRLSMNSTIVKSNIISN